MRFANQIGYIKERQNNLVAVERDIKTGCKKLEREIRKVVAARLREVFPTVRWEEGDWLVGVQGGCMTNRWTPEVYFYSVGGASLSNKGFWFEKFDKVNSPVNAKEFLVFLKELSNELGLHCRFCRHEPHRVEVGPAMVEAEFNGDDL